MTSLLSALSCVPFNAHAPARPAQEVSETEYQSVFAATAILLAGGTALILSALSQAF